MRQGHGSKAVGLTGVVLSLVVCTAVEGRFPVSGWDYDITGLEVSPERITEGGAAKVEVDVTCRDSADQTGYIRVDLVLTTNGVKKVSISKNCRLYGPGKTTKVRFVVRPSPPGVYQVDASVHGGFGYSWQFDTTGKRDRFRRTLTILPVRRPFPGEGEADPRATPRSSPSGSPVVRDEYTYAFPVGDFFGRKTGEGEAKVGLSVELLQEDRTGCRSCVVTLRSSAHPMGYAAVLLGFPKGASEDLQEIKTYLKKGDQWVEAKGISEADEKEKWKVLGSVTGRADNWVGLFVEGLGFTVDWLRAEYRRDIQRKLATWRAPVGTRAYGQYNMPGASRRGWQNIRWVIKFKAPAATALFVAASCYTYSPGKGRLLQCKIPLRGTPRR